MKFEKELENPVTLTLEAADIFYLREFLYEERISAEVDFGDIENLHNNRARQKAKQALNREHMMMTKITNALDATLDATEGRGVIAAKVVES